MLKAAEIKAFEIKGGAKCIHCNAKLTNRLLDRAQAFDGQHVWVCFECQQIRFDGNEEECITATHAAIAKAQIEYLRSPGKAESDRREYEAWNDRCRFWVEEEQRIISEWRRRRKAGEICSIPAPVDFTAQIPRREVA